MLTWINGVHNCVDATRRDHGIAPMWAAMAEVQDCLLKDFAAGKTEFLVWCIEDDEEIFLVRVERSPKDELQATIVAQTRL